jgi:hypothetical protein
VKTDTNKIAASFIGFWFAARKAVKDFAAKSINERKKIEFLTRLDDTISQFQHTENDSDRNPLYCGLIELRRQVEDQNPRMTYGEFYAEAANLDEIRNEILKFR